MKKPRIRHDGWTVARRNRFLAALRDGASIAVAARAAGMSRESAHRLRARAGAEAFAAAWDAAQTEARRREGAAHRLRADGILREARALEEALMAMLQQNPDLRFAAPARLVGARA